MGTGLEIGMRGEASLVVCEADTARALRSGEVEVLGTPRVIALVEEAACAALVGRVPAGHTTVGMRVQIDHLHPTPIGVAVDAEAILEKIEGRRLTFTVSAADAKGLVAAGKVTRVLVEVSRFMSKAE
jgi:fluoroacetyl-CoA thioesterase